MTWPAVRDTQYGRLRLIDATLSTLITATAAMRKQLINRLTMFVTSDRPRYLGDCPSPLPTHLLVCLFFSPSFSFGSHRFDLSAYLFPQEMSLLTPLFPSSITFASASIRTEAPACGFQVSSLTLNGVVRSSLDFFLHRHFKDALDFDTSRTLFLPGELNCSNYLCEETRIIGNDEAAWGLCSSVIDFYHTSDHIPESVFSDLRCCFAYVRRSFSRSAEDFCIREEN